MKNIFYLASLVALLATASCKDDDGEPAPTPTGDIMFDGHAYTGRKGIVVDLGGDDDHYNMDFVLLDANISVEELQEDPEEIDATFFLYAELYSPGTENFRTGTFGYGEYADDNDYYFNDVDLAVDSNNDNKLSDADEFYDAEGGTITVTGTPNNYTLTFDVILDGGKKLTGSYSGNFDYIDGTAENGRISSGRLRNNANIKLTLK